MPDQRRWDALCQRLRADANIESGYRQLVCYYSEGHRAYHNLTHVDDCLTQYDSARHLADSPDQLEFAIWCHDVIYDTHASDNESQSSQWAKSVLYGAGVTKQIVDGVVELILATEHRTQPSSPDASLMVDIDLSILGRPSAEYDQYAQAIREEYAWVPKEAYAQGRISVLKSFLDRAAIYFTDHFQRQFEQTARGNLQRELGILRRTT